MPRLVTFGCSHVYGHGLPDCYIPPDNPGPNSSKFAWPQLLADKLGYECCNLARCGSGNFEIIMKIIKTDFLPDDLVITAWSYFSRYDYYKITDYSGKGSRIKTDVLKEELKKHEQYMQQNYWDNFLIIHYGEKYLESKKIKNFGYLGTHVPKTSIPELHFNNFLDISLIQIDNALDGKHPGMESHKLQAETIYTLIKDKINV